MADKTKIDWAEASWNPVTGCKHDCEYCYARKMAWRYGGYDGYGSENDMESCEGGNGDIFALDKPCYVIGQGGKMQNAPYPFMFRPTFHRYRLDTPARWTRPRNIFVCSIADLFGDWVPVEWIREVFKACAAAQQHRYLFLTKNPQRYNELYRYNLPYLENAMFGYTLDQSHTQEWFEQMKPPQGKDVFVSVEPITEPLNTFCFRHILECGWVIVGAETGNRRTKAIPEKWWIDVIAKQCKANFIPIFMKDSLRDLMGADFRQEYPWEVDSLG